MLSIVVGFTTFDQSRYGHIALKYVEVIVEGRWIDVREYPEFSQGHIEGAEHVPLGNLERACASWDRSEPITLVCRSGRRAEQARQQLVAKGFQSANVLEGGVEGWTTQGKSLTVVENGPWSMERQVRVTAGTLVLTFLGLGALTSKRFFIGAGLVGAGLVYAGISDNCMMASLLGRLPWNTPKQANA